MTGQQQLFLTRIHRFIAKNSTIFFTVVYLLASLSFPSEKQIEKSPDRRALFEMAYSNMSFLLYMFSQDNSFQKQLNENEKRMFFEILGIAQEATAINWFKKKNITMFSVQNEFAATYVVQNNQFVKLITPEQKIFQIQFSEDQSLFDLDENKNVRTAGTDTAMDKDIFVNLKRINDKNTNLDFAAAFSLMIHEFGHKIGPTKNLPAINSMAAKAEETIRALTRTKKMGELQVHQLSFKFFPNYDGWVESLLMGEFLGVNIPKKLHPLTVFDNQGLYVWTEDQNGVNDISEQVRSDFKKHALIPYNKDPRYTFVDHDIILASSIDVIPLAEKNSFKIITNGNILRMVLPFLQHNSYDPAAYHLYERSFPSSPNYTGDIVNYEQEYSLSESKTYKKTQSTQRPLNYKSPSLQGKIIAQSLMEKDFILRVQIDADLQIRINPYQSNSKDELWPELGIVVGENRLVLPAEKRISEQSNIFEFRIKNFDKLKGKKVLVNDLQFTVKNKYLTLSAGNTITKGFLESAAVLNAETATPTVVKKSELKKLLIWSGTQWEELNSENVKSGQQIRIVFESDEKLRQLILTQEYNITHKVQTMMAGKLIPSVGISLEKQSREFYFNENQMRQELSGSVLAVDLNMDQFVITHLKSPINLTPSDSSSNPSSFNFMPTIIEIHESMVQPERIIQGLKWTGESGNSVNNRFEKTLKFNKLDAVTISTESNKSSSSKTGKLKCEGLFIY
jgi:hypothetical protein